MADTIGGVPHLESTTISRFTKSIWDTRHTDSKMHASFKRPIMTDVDSDYYFLGDLALPYRSRPAITTMSVVRAVDDDPDQPLLAKPVGWERVWTSKNTGKKKHGSIWAPTPPSGYVACGHVIQDSYYDEPSSKNFEYYDRFACVHASMCEQVDVGTLVWDDRGSGANKSVTVFEVTEIKDFVSYPGHVETRGMVWVPTILVIR